MKRSEWTAGDDNVARLLGQSYDPPMAPAAFAQRVQARLLEVAAERARPRRASMRRTRWMALAALLAILALGVCLLPRPAAPSSSPTLSEQRLTVAAPLTPTPAPRLSLGARIATKAGERRRVALADGSVLSLNENTLVSHDAARHVTLTNGEIFVEVAPRLAGKAASLFTVATPHREIQAVGTKFLVRAGDDGTGVAVAQGQVHVSDWDGLLSAGQQLAPKADAVAPTPRLSYLLDWTRDLAAAAAPPLVPPNPHAGGALVAIDTQGHAANLSLRKYHIDVHVEDGVARTTIDQTYFNHTLGRLEGTFYFPLPTDASLSRLAMYVDGQLMEGGMVERDYGRIVFEQIVTKQKDPALLEWVDGHTFKMRVFPLEARQEKRIILSYTQRLPNLYGRWSYRFPAGHSLGAVKDWSFHARVKDGKCMTWHCASHALTPRIERGDLLLDASLRQAAMERDVALELTEPSVADSVRFSTATQDGQRYLMLRYRPELWDGFSIRPSQKDGFSIRPSQKDGFSIRPSQKDGLKIRPTNAAKRQRRDWVFLFESSAERDPLLARTQVEIVRTLLAHAEADDTFAVLSAAARVQRFAPSPQRATPENVAAALAFLEKSHLLGALDLDAGLTAAAELLRAGENPILVHLGCGQAVLGERRADVLAERIPRQACYVGVGVGKHWSQDFMRRAAERCQGYVTEINPDEPVAWRAFDLLAALNTPRVMGVRVADLADKVHFLCPNFIVAQGEELCAIARLSADAPLPEALRISGTLDGQPFCEVLPVESPRSDAAYLPRTWARLEIDRLLAEDAAKNKQTIIALSKAMYVMTPYTSLLVLENEAMYAQYKVDRGRKDHWAMYPCPAKIPVVSEWPENVSGPYTIQLEAPSIERVSIAVQSDAQLQERIRQENRERRSGVTQWMMNPYQGYLSGAADITRAHADFQQGIQQARLMREEVRRSVLQRRRAMIEEAEWDRERMPDPEKIRQQALTKELARARVRPPLTDIVSSRSLNALLHHLSAQQEQGVRGPNVPLSEDMLEHINLTVGDGRINTGLLKQEGNLQWPASLQGKAFTEARARLTAKMKTAFDRLKSGHAPDDVTLRDLRSNLDKMQETLLVEVDRLMPEEYIESARYLRSLKNTIAALENPHAAAHLHTNWRAKGKNVVELVRFMRDKKLCFAPATAGDVAAYLALYQALILFDARLRAERVRPPTFVLFENADAVRPSPIDADSVLMDLLAEPAQLRSPLLWRKAAVLAEQHKKYKKSLQYLYRALELERQQPRDWESKRRDYAWMFDLARRCLNDRTAARDWLGAITTAADQWRARDAEDWRPCWLAGNLLLRAGERDLAWDYLTSPSFLQHGEARPWLELARQQHWQEEYDFAERAFAVAASLEPSNAEIVWERALNHRAAGRAAAARTLWEQLDKGVWDNRYDGFQRAAQRALHEEHE